MKPRHWVPRGRRAAIGVVVDPALTGERAARLRILRWASAGAKVYRTGHGLVVCWPSARELVEPYPGAPLLMTPQGACTAPLDPDEVASAPRFALLTGGQLVALDLSRPEDPGEWLLLELPVLDGASLGAPPAEAAPALAAVAFGARDLGISGLADERTAIAALLRSPGPPSGLEQVLRGLGALTAKMRRSGQGAPAGPGLLGGLERWLARQADRVGLSSMLGARYQRYLDDLMSRFASGDVMEALRRAIPLGGEGGDGQPGLFGSLPLRSGLDLSFGARGAAGRSLGTLPSLYEQLRKAYLAAAERLERDGNIRAAAFVHDELLGDATAAVALLERHGEYAVAAKLAEARKLAPGLVVRLWWVGGDPQRALLVARREHAFVDALVRLQDQPDAQRLLRRAWSLLLAKEGRWRAALDAVGDDPTLQDIAEEWLDRGIAEGSTASGDLLLRKALRDADALPALADVVRGWAAADDPVALEALLSSLSSSAPHATFTPFARLACRLALTTTVPMSLVSAAATRQAAGALAADVPKVADEPRGAAVVSPSDVGAAPILDCARAMDGSWIVALGDAGVVRLDGTGRVMARYEWPAVSLVPSAERNRFVLLGARGGRARALARLDLTARALEPWSEVELDVWDRQSDGDLWFVARGDDVFAIDLLAGGWQFLWSQRGCGGPVLAIAATAGGVRAVVGEPVHQVWGWDRPGLMLRQRADYSQPAHVLSRGKVALVDRGGTATLVSWGFALDERGPSHRVGDHYAPGMDLADANGDALLIVDVDGLRLDVGGAARARLLGAHTGGVRVSGADRWAFDDLGRIVYVSASDRVRIVRLALDR